MIFPAGVGSVETRRRYDWLRMVLPGARLFRAPICGGGPSSALSGGYAPDSAKAEGSSIVDEPAEC